MRIGRLIFGGFVTRYGWQVEIGIWIRGHFWVTLLLKALFGSAFFGISGVEGGWFSYGIHRYGNTWTSNFKQWIRYEFEILKYFFTGRLGEPVGWSRETVAVIRKLIKKQREVSA